MRILNLGVFAHADAGKTTVVSRLLFENGETRELGNVDDGTAVTDSLSIERDRGISVKAASAVITVGETRINVIDAPGHADFMAEVQRALSAVDCALLIVSAAEGVQSQTETYFKGIQSGGLPLIIFVNKIDRIGVDTEAVLSEIREKLSENIYPLNAATAQGSRDCSVTETDFTEDDELGLCGLDGALGEEWLGGEKLTRNRLVDSLFGLCSRGKAYPLIFGSAARGVGFDTLQQAISRLPTVNSAELGGELGGRIYKIEHDKVMGKAAYVRLFGGAIRNRDNVPLSGVDGERTDKATQIRRFSAGTKTADCGELTAGDVGIVYGLQSAKVGDIVGAVSEARNKPLLKPVPLFNVKVTDGDPNPAPLLAAVRELTEEDPLLSCEWAADERELTVSVMGEIQIDVLKYLLAERYGIKADFAPPTVIYKETPLNRGVGFEAYTMPKPCWAIIELTIEPSPLGGGYAFNSVIKGEQIPYKYQTHIRTTLDEAMKQGLFGWEVTDLSITLTGGGYHYIHTHPQDFFLATPVAFMNGMTNCGSQLLEPFLRVRITIDESLSGRVIGDVIGMRGSFDSPVVKNGTAYIESCLPLSESMDYPARVASLSAGKARYSAAFDGYRPCPAELSKTAPRRGVDPRDRALWILSKRQAF